MSYIRQRPLWKFRGWVVESLDKLDRSLYRVDNWNEAEHRELGEDIAKLEKRIEKLEEKK